MFCTSLRKRPEFAPILPSLLSSKSPQWREKTLETHDIALPLLRGGTKPDFFRLLLLSESDVEPLARIERLLHLTGGRQVGVVFLLKEQFSNGKRNGMIAYLSLQASLLSSAFELPLIPLSVLKSLPTALTSFQHQLIKPHPAPKIVNPCLALLPYCSSDPPLAEHTAHVLSDVCRSLSHLSEITSTQEGQAELGKYIEKGEHLEAVVQFWEVEHYANG